MTQPIPFGNYFLLERVNVGGMAEVFKAKAIGVRGFERSVAVKRILPNIAEDEEFIAMFIDEAKIAVQLTHANIAQIFDLGKVEDSYFIALEYIRGKDFRAIFNRCRSRGKPMPVPLVCYAIMKVCEGLDYAHQKRDADGQLLNLVHRDVSPQNLLISYEGEVKIIDFGIAKAAGKAGQTQSGILKGKFGYMSPEQIEGLEIDRRSDLFGLGICLYEMLTGERLFVAETDLATLEKVKKVEIVPPSQRNPLISKDLEVIVLKALAKDRKQRHQTALELFDDLQAYLYQSGQVHGRKDLASFMREHFGAEITRENTRDRSYSGIGFTDPADAVLPHLAASDPAPAPLAPAGGKSPVALPQAVSAAKVGKRGSSPVALPAGAGRPVQELPAGVLSSVRVPPHSAFTMPTRPTPEPTAALASMGGPTGQPPQRGEGGAQQNGAQGSAYGRTSNPGEPRTGQKVAGAVHGAEALAVPAASSLEYPWPGGEDDGGETRIYDRPEAVAEALDAAVGGATPPAGYMSLPPTLQPSYYGLEQAGQGVTPPFGIEAQPRRKRRWVLLALGALLVCAAGVGVLAAGVFDALWGTGAIELATVPPTAQVLLDGEPVEGQSPFLLDEVSPGVVHHVVVKHVGFESRSIRVQVEPGETLALPAVTLRASPTGFVLSSDPAGASIAVDGESTGQLTPATVAGLPPGTHTIVVTKAGYKRWVSSAIHIADGQLVKLPVVKLSRTAQGTAVAAVVAGEVSGASGRESSVVGSASSAGATAAAGSAGLDRDDEAGERSAPAARTTGSRRVRGGSYQARLRKVYERAQERAQELAALEAADQGDERTGSRDVRPLDDGFAEASALAADVGADTEEAPAGGVAEVGTGTLRVNSRPWTVVFVDGREVGPTPQMHIEVPAGVHELVLVNRDFSLRHRLRVDVPAGETVVKALNLLDAVRE